LTAEQRERLQQELVGLRNAEMDREWALVEFYLRKNQPASVAVHCNRILHRYPDTEIARRAWEVLQEQERGGESRRQFSLWPFADDENVDETASSSRPPIAGQPPMPTETPAPTPAPEEDASDSGGLFPRFGNPLRRTERTPQLVEPPAAAEETDTPDYDAPARVRL
jgi:hypothetical protein